MTPLNILIVDDQPINLRLLRAELEAEGHIVFEGMNGVEGLAVLDSQQIDVIISDILMPVMDGYRFCYEVRRSERFREIPFIVYTSTYLSPSDEKLSLDLGADRYLRKPASVEQIKQTIVDVLATPRRRPTAVIDSTDVLKEYNAGLVTKLEKKNVELSSAMSLLTLQSTALETTADAMLITDAHGVIIWVNPAFTTATGYAPDEVIGKTPRILKSGLQDEAFYRRFWETISSGQTFRGEFINRRKDGSVYFDEHTVTPVCAVDGAVTHFVGVMHDITERRRTEEQLREANAQLREFLDHSPAVLYALRVEGERIVPRFASENITRLLGYEAEEALSYEWWLSQMHDDDRDRAAGSIAHTLADGSSRNEYRLRHRDGHFLWIEDQQRLARDKEGRPAEIVGVWTDITDHRRPRWPPHVLQRLLPPTDGLVARRDHRRRLFRQVHSGAAARRGARGLHVPPCWCDTPSRSDERDRYAFRRTEAHPVEQLSALLRVGRSDRRREHRRGHYRPHGTREAALPRATAREPRHARRRHRARSQQPASADPDGRHAAQTLRSERSEHAGNREHRAQRQARQ
jgi:PAS domain S-box-containing protein